MKPENLPERRRVRGKRGGRRPRRRQCTGWNAYRRVIWNSAIGCFLAGLREKRPDLRRRSFSELRSAFGQAWDALEPGEREEFRVESRRLRQTGSLPEGAEDWCLGLNAIYRASRRQPVDETSVPRRRWRVESERVQPVNSEPAPGSSLEPQPGCSHWSQPVLPGAGTQSDIAPEEVASSP